MRGVSEAEESGTSGDEASGSIEAESFGSVFIISFSFFYLYFVNESRKVYYVFFCRSIVKKRGHLL